MYTWMVGQVETSKKQDVPDRTGNGDAIAGVANPFTAMGSSSSSSGDIVSSDCMSVNDMHGEGRRKRTSGFFFGLRPEDLRRPLSVTADAEGVVVSTTGVDAPGSSLSSEATISSD